MLNELCAAEVQRLREPISRLERQQCQENREPQIILNEIFRGNTAAIPRQQEAKDQALMAIVSHPGRMLHSIQQTIYLLEGRNKHRAIRN